jgi:hypothetical protein
VRRPTPVVPLLLAGALFGCPKEKETVSRTPPPRPSATPAASPSAPSPPASPQAQEAAGGASASRAQEEACLDRWLAERKLDRYGSPAGTMYTGGTPLFDEVTGRSVDRLDYVYGKHPAAREACAPRGSR